MRLLARRGAQIIEVSIAHASELLRPFAKRLSDMISQQASHISTKVGYGVDLPEFDNVPVNRRDEQT
ncbi:MAG: hypothetical protein DCO98_11955 [Altererythrobacter sp. XM-24bin4]|nr:MAG: hypothetical protein DCO81_07290 [Candidatus Aquiluna sp. XM-24bin5]PWL23539.1 MAG: hypothetical protein DCO98_11955 [Altererythrobacter sp. XM-24bin4]